MVKLKDHMILSKKGRGLKKVLPPFGPGLGGVVGSGCQLLKLRRMSELANVLRAYKIVLDGDIFGRIRNGKEVVLHLPRGIHHLHLEIDWCRSNAVEIDLGDDEVVLECGSNYTGLGLFRGVFKILIGCENYLWLRRIDPTA